MLKASLVLNPPFDKNEVFNTNSPLNRDSCLAFFHCLKEELERKNVFIATSDLQPTEQSDFIIYIDMPKTMPVDKKRAVVILYESEVIRPDNWDLSKHEWFHKIFTWNDTFVDNKKYFKNNFIQSGQVPFLDYDQKNKFCTLIAGNKVVKHPLELYSKRREAIRWFEREQPEAFEFYGVGWNSYQFQIPVIGRVLNRFPSLRKMMAESWPSYKGTLSSKLDTLKEYKFSICYENAMGIPGYITEKVFDSMAAGCIPVYWGAPNILKYVPKECLILKEEFKNYEELYSFMKKMSPEEYNRRLRVIAEYLQSDDFKFFQPRTSAKNFVSNLLGIS